jgi:phosphoglycolate phosphatase
MLYPLVILDFDGTIADSTGAIAALFNESLQATGFEAAPESEIRHRIGLSLAKITEDLTGLPPEHERHIELVQDYRERCFAGGLAHVQYFDGMQELLLELRAQGVTLAIATGKAIRGLLENLDANHGREGFAAMATSDRVQNGKPAPDLVHLVLEETGFAKTDAVLIGDTTHDVHMGHNAGIPTIAVSYGAHSAEQLAPSEPAQIVHSVAELRSALLPS